MPFAMLLLVVFLYRHLITILTFFWLTSLLHNANERMRRQTLLKDHRSAKALVSLLGLLGATIGCISLVQGHQRLALQLQLRWVDNFSAEPPALSTVVWDVVLTDLCARRGIQVEAKTLDPHTSRLTVEAIHELDDHAAFHRFRRRGPILL